jgi:spore coat polysaccharide biosynthesis protein SpsF
MIRAFVYARMSSRRLPGKVLAEVGGEPMLGRVVRRVSAVSPVVVLTSDHVSDDVVAGWAARFGVACVRGDLYDLAGRTTQALREHPCEAFFRVNADSPFVLPALLTRARSIWDATSHVDLVSNLVTRTYPYGIAVELIRASVFEAAVPSMSAEEREHITVHFYAHAERYRIQSLKHERDWSSHRLVVDSPEDLSWVQRVLAAHPDCDSWNVDRLVCDLAAWKRTYFER